MLERYDYDIYELQHDDIYNVVEVHVGTGNRAVDVLEIIVCFGLAGILAALLVTMTVREHRDNAARAECAKRWDCSVESLRQ